MTEVYTPPMILTKVNRWQLLLRAIHRVPDGRRFILAEFRHHGHSAWLDEAQVVFLNTPTRLIDMYLESLPCRQDMVLGDTDIFVEEALMSTEALRDFIKASRKSLPPADSTPQGVTADLLFIDDESEDSCLFGD